MGESSRKYENGKIYCIRNNVDGDIYVGHTTQALSKRMDNHRACINSNHKKHRALYQKMVTNGAENFYIELLQKCPCDDIEELRQCEGEWIRKLATLNHCIAGQSKKEYNAQYYLNNKDKCNQQSRQWQADNQEREKERLRQRYQNRREEIHERRSEKHNCECGGRYTTGHKSHHFKSKKHQAYLQQKEHINS